MIKNGRGYIKTYPKTYRKIKTGKKMVNKIDKTIKKRRK